MKELDYNTVESSEMVEQTFKFWFSDTDHIRSPFPEYMQNQLRKDATKMFFRWTKQLEHKAKEDMDEEMIGEKFEEVIFESATKLIKTEDERITIVYPFLPRLGDKIEKEEKEEEEDSIITDRALIKEGDTSYLQLKLENIKSKEKWETKMEVPI